MILNLTTDSSAKYVSLEVIEVIKSERIFELIASVAVKENGFYRDNVNYLDKNLWKIFTTEKNNLQIFYRYKRVVALY